jgi:hypothetical protein
MKSSESWATSCPRAVEDPGAVPACSHGEGVTLSSSGGGGVMLQPVSFRGTQSSNSKSVSRGYNRRVCHCGPEPKLLQTPQLTRRVRYLRFSRQRLHVQALWDVSPATFMFYDLFNDAVNITDCIGSNDRPFNE